MLRETLVIALRGLRSHKMRSALTMLGLIIGVAAVILLTAFGQGVAGSVNSAVSTVANSITVVPKLSAIPGGPPAEPLTDEDAKAIAKLSNVAQLVPVVNGSTTGAAGQQSTAVTASTPGAQYLSATVTGTTANYLAVKQAKLAAGAFFSQAQGNNGAKVAVLGPLVATALYGPDPTAAIGKPLRIDHANFTVIGVLQSYGASGDGVIVMPEGGAMGLYVDWWDQGRRASAKWEGYYLRELIPMIEQRYRIRPQRRWHAIAGLSMGGYGAMKFGLKFPDKFVFAASMSGALQAPELDQIPQVPAFILTSVKRAFGPVDSPVRANNDIYKLVGGLLDDRKKQLPYFYLDCGTEDDLVQSNRKFSGMLISAKIRHEFRELPGTHSWPYWDQQVQEVLRIATRIFNHTQSAPATTVSMGKQTP